MAYADIKQALTSTSNMDCYLEVTSSKEVIEDILSFIPKEAELRDHFAAMALQPVLAKTYRMLTDENSYVDSVPSLAAAFSYEVADAMLKVRGVKS